MFNLELAHEGDDELRVRAAWLYYVANLNQEEAARRLGLTRARVNRLLAEARDLGLVSITIEHRLQRMLAVEATIAERHGLDFCLATPPLGLDPATARDPAVVEVTGAIARRAVGVAAANFLKARLTATPETIVGVGWGRTIEQMTLHLGGIRAPRARFCSLMGSLTRNSASNPFEVVHALGARTGGEGHFLPVPYIADLESDREVLMGQRSVAETLALAARADFHLISIGEIAATALLRRENMVGAEDVATLRAAGAVGDAIGIFFDAEGRAVDHPLNRRTLAISHDILRRRPVVLLAAGFEKQEAVAALLRGGMIRGLIIDGDSALALADV
jgi:DNA-binding transcriptional regulator LsrR (DeoR family)